MSHIKLSHMPLMVHMAEFRKSFDIIEKIEIHFKDLLSTYRKALKIKE